MSSLSPPEGQHIRCAQVIAGNGPDTARPRVDVVGAPCGRRMSAWALRVDAAATAKHVEHAVNRLSADFPC